MRLVKFRKTTGYQNPLWCIHTKSLMNIQVKSGVVLRVVDVLVEMSEHTVGDIFCGLRHFG